MNDADTIATQAAEIAQLRKERNDYAEEARNAGEYVREIGVLLGCADGDDTPKDRIAQLRETVAAHQKVAELRDAQRESDNIAFAALRATIATLTRERDEARGARTLLRDERDAAIEERNHEKREVVMWKRRADDTQVELNQYKDANSKHIAERDEARAIARAANNEAAERMQQRDSLASQLDAANARVRELEEKESKWRALGHKIAYARTTISQQESIMDIRDLL